MDQSQTKRAIEGHKGTRNTSQAFWHPLTEIPKTSQAFLGPSQALTVVPVVPARGASQAKTAYNGGYVRESV